MANIGLYGRENMEALHPSLAPALQRWADSHGPDWRDQLAEAWATGRYGRLPNPDDSAHLQKIRNTYGPSWLAAFKFAS